MKLRIFNKPRPYKANQRRVPIEKLGRCRLDVIVGGQIVPIACWESGPRPRLDRRIAEGIVKPERLGWLKARILHRIRGRDAAASAC